MKAWLRLPVQLDPRISGHVASAEDMGCGCRPVSMHRDAIVTADKAAFLQQRQHPHASSNSSWGRDDGQAELLHRHASLALPAALPSQVSASWHWVSTTATLAFSSSKSSPRSRLGSGRLASVDDMLESTTRIILSDSKVSGPCPRAFRQAGARMTLRWQQVLPSLCLCMTVQPAPQGVSYRNRV